MPVSHLPTCFWWYAYSLQRFIKKKVALMPVPQTFTSGAEGFSTNCLASGVHVFKAPSPAPSPSTGWFSMYTFWLMSKRLFATRTLPAALVKLPRKKRVEIFKDCIVRLLEFALSFQRFGLV